MKLSYEGIGQWAATFACDDLAEGELVKVSANGTVAACAAGDDFCGMVLSVGRGGDACAVALGGMVTAGYTVPAEGAAPALGWSGLSADGEGGVQADADGSTYLVVDVDTTAKTQTPSCFSPNSRHVHLAVSCSGRGIWKKAKEGNMRLLRAVTRLLLFLYHSI